MRCMAGRGLITRFILNKLTKKQSKIMLVNYTPLINNIISVMCAMATQISLKKVMRAIMLFKLLVAYFPLSTTSRNDAVQ